MEYHLEECKMLNAERTKNVSELQALMHSKFLKIQTASSCKCFLLNACSIDEVIDHVKEFKDDESLIQVVEYLVEKRSCGELVKVLSPEHWEDLVEFLEQFITVIKGNGGLLSLVSCLRIYDRAMKVYEDNGEFRRSFTQGLLEYCKFKLNKNPHVRLEAAIQFARSCIPTPRPEEHKEVLQYLAKEGVDISQYGYDPALHGHIPVITPLHVLVKEMVEKEEGLSDILKLGEKGLLELLYMGYSIDFATNNYSLVDDGDGDGDGDESNKE